MSPNLKGIVATLTASLFFVTSDTLIKLTARHLPVGEMLFLRGTILVSGLAALILVSGQGRGFIHLTNRLVVQRSLLEALVSYFFISALALVPIGNLTAIFLTSPLMLTAASAFLLKEQVGWRRWSAVGAGFCGMLLVVKPAPSGFMVISLFGLASAAVAVGRDLTTRRIEAGTPSLIVTFGASLSVAVLGLVLYPFEQWLEPSSSDLLRLLASAMALGCGTFSIIVAYRSAEASVLSPFRYGVIVLALASGYIIWGDIPDSLALSGIVLILVANLYVVHRERVRAKRPPQLIAGKE